MHFSLSGKRYSSYRPLNVAVLGHGLEQVDHAKFLGFHVDRVLSWETHIDKLCSKLGSACFALKRLSSTLPSEIVRTCYFATVQSVLQYGIEFWGRAADWERAFRMQKRAVRAIAQIPQDSSARPWFRTYRMLTLPALIIFQAAVYAKENEDLYPKQGEHHAHNTRNKHKMALVQKSLAKSGKLIHVMAPAVYNRIPSTIKDAPSTEAFKLRLKKWLIEQDIYNYDQWILNNKD
ncbi:hypothetical protein NE865_10256 [Phthorimaea operculella]|nr:hypothetical protein NE865_10256 [Phthorimaea operculella]